MSDIFDLLQQVPDALKLHEEATNADCARLCPIDEETKRPLMNKWNKVVCTSEEIKAHKKGFGFIIGYAPDGESRYVVIDVDIKNLEANESFTKTLLTTLGDSVMVIKTASDKYHLIVRITGEFPQKGIHDVGKTFKYPVDFFVEELRGKRIADSGEVEIFTKPASKQTNTVGCRRNGNTYHVAQELSKYSTFHEIPIITGEELHKRIEKALLYAGYTTCLPLDSKSIAEKSNIEFEMNTKRAILPDYKIDLLADFCIDLYKHNDGAKHHMTLPLGNYLSEFVSYDSAVKLSEVIIKKEPNLFKSNEAFQQTLLKHYDGDDNSERTGGHTLVKEYASHMTPQEAWFKLLWFSGTQKVGFHPSGRVGKTYRKIVFNSWTKQVEMETIRHRKNDDGVYEPYVESVRPVLGFEIIRIKRIENVIIPSASDKFVLEYIPSGRNRIKKLSGTSLKEIEDKLKQEIGIVLDGQFSFVFNQIIAFFTRNNLIESQETSPVGGIFEIDNELHRYDYDLKEIKPNYNLQKLKSALELLIEIRDILPTENEKFGAICRVGLLLGLNFVLKKKGHLAKYVVFLGAGKTGKSTIAELLVNFYNKTRINSISGNVFNGGAFSSPYQVGLKYGISSYPLVINECGAAFNNDDIIEIMKSAIESSIARSTADGAYYSYSTLIFTSNVDIRQTDAMIRRSNIFYFAPSERLSEDDIDNLADLCNETGVNSRFKELNEIGQFVFTFAHDNLHLLKELSTEELELRVIEELENVTGTDLDFMKHDVKEDNNTIIEEIDNEVLADLLGEIKRVYNYNFRNFNNFSYEEDEGMDTSVEPFSERNLISLISRGAIPFLIYNPKNDDIFIAGNRAKQFFAKKGRLVSNTQLYDEFEPFADEYDVEKKRFMVEGKRLRGISIEPDLLLNLLNNTL